MMLSPTSLIHDSKDRHHNLILFLMLRCCIILFDLFMYQYVCDCEVWDLFSYKIIITLGCELIDMFMLIPALLPSVYPAGKGTGQDSYPSRLEGKGI
jgi:hypothetical protein